MTILELYTLLTPLIQFLGTICLIALSAGGVLFTIAWVISKTWKYILSFGAISFVLFAVVLILGSM